MAFNAADSFVQSPARELVTDVAYEAYRLPCSSGFDDRAERVVPTGLYAPICPASTIRAGRAFGTLALGCIKGQLFGASSAVLVN